MRAAFQNTPRNPFLLRSKIEGYMERTYAHVHITNNTTTSRLWKLKTADIVITIRRQLLQYSHNNFTVPRYTDVPDRNRRQPWG